MRPDRSAGFTLIELLVAFTVAAFVLSAIYEIFSGGARAVALSQHMNQALLLAQSELDAVSGTAITEGRVTERIGPYERTTDIRPRPDLAPPDPQAAAVAYEITVQIAWRDGVRPRTVALSTLWLAPRNVQAGTGPS